jgi:uncharacterized repeat protein (TIGR01451 family)
MVGKNIRRWLSAVVLGIALIAGDIGPAGLAMGVQRGGDDTPTLRPGAQPLPMDEETEERLLLLDQAFISSRTAGDKQLSVEQAGGFRGKAADEAKALKHALPSGPSTFTAAWSALGPNPIVQNGRSDGSYEAMSGRIGALVIRKNGQFILGAAQGGIWLYDPIAGTWTPKTDTLGSLAIGALAVAPSNDSIVYAGTGEGALSGDSYYGNGVLKSTDGGATWAHISGDFFAGVSTARIAVDPTNPDHLYAAILRGRGGARRVSPPVHSTYGIWESTDGAVTWTLLKAAPAVSLGATDITLDPQNPKTIYASFWSDAIYKSTDGGQTWATIMNGLPAGDFASALTRFALSISHPSGQAAVLYTGFDWEQPAGTHFASRLFKSTDEGASWVELPHGTGADSVLDYCATQCFYDNVIEADPTNSNIVFAAGQFGYNLSPASGGIFRSIDGGQTWKNLGWNQHPDFHALAFDPSNPANVLIGSDGGVWYSTARGGRNADGDPLSAVDWQDLNGTVNPSSSAVLHRTGLQISQFTSAGAVPTTLVPVGGATQRFWGGTQDNGTLRKSVNSQTWFDVASGDGGQVVVDQTDNSGCPLGACFVYGTYFGVSLFRYTDGGNFFSNGYILNGINTKDRSDFYIPVALNQLNTNKLFTGTYRLYRTDNAKAPLAGDVVFKAVSPDLTSGCTGTAPNGARTCALSAIGIGGGNAVYTGSLDGYVYFSADAQVSDNPTWKRVGSSGESGEGRGHGNDGHKNNVKLPRRPVASIAVDRSDYRTAYIAYNGYNQATPNRPGHVFKTTDAGKSWSDISGNLPDNPVNSISIDASYPNTLYAATDVGPFVTYNGGATWSALGTGFPIVAIDQIDLNTYDRLMVAGTHGRGAFRLVDNTAAVPSLVISKADAGVPVGPGSFIDYAITLRNIGNAPATGVKITDPLPANTSFVSADNGGTFARGHEDGGGIITWTGLSVAPNASITVNLRVQISSSLKSKVTSITDDGYKATSAEGPTATGSPTITPIAPAYGVSVSPASQTGGGHTGQSQHYTVTVKNLGYKNDSYNLTSTGGTYAVSFYDSTCTTAQAATASLNPGATADVCVKVDVPTTATDGASSTSTITATSVASPTVSASATIKTIAVTVDTLLVDEDGNAPNVSNYYSDALTAAGFAFDTWDLAVDRNLPAKYLSAFKNVVWFTGNSYPGPIQPYETSLKAYLDGGGHLFLSGQDILDQAAGKTPFVKDYLHVDWDGSENQNDKKTLTVTGVTGNPVSNGIGAVPLDFSVLGGAAFMDQITPNGTSMPAFTDDGSNTADGSGPQPDALSFSGPSAATGTNYQVVFLAFPFEEYGSAAQKSDLIKRTMTFFGS